MLTAGSPLVSDLTSPAPVIVMGVSGCGKSSVGRLLAVSLEAEFIEGDDLHSPHNVSKMQAGIPLTDDDRWPWLDAIGNRLAWNPNVVVSCSALRRVYRERLRVAAGRPLTFVCLQGPRQLLFERISARQNHYMPAALLDSQFNTLELPTDEDDAIIVDIERSAQNVADLALPLIVRRR
ncbi:gluconokinase [Ochrobactrum sp. BTU1]|nr:gluconokinase [Ochrobactrum sp. BTU1]